MSAPKGRGITCKSHLCLAEQTPRPRTCKRRFAQKRRRRSNLPPALQIRHLRTRTQAFRAGWFCNPHLSRNSSSMQRRTQAWRCLPIAAKRPPLLQLSRPPTRSSEPRPAHTCELPGATALRSGCCGFPTPLKTDSQAGMAELVDARDLKSLGLVPSGFKSRCLHQSILAHQFWRMLSSPAEQHLHVCALRNAVLPWRAERVISPNPQTV